MSQQAAFKCKACYVAVHPISLTKRQIVTSALCHHAPIAHCVLQCLPITDNACMASCCYICIITSYTYTNRAAAYPNLLHVPVLYNILVGGQPWLAKVQQQWPLEPMMLYHACFAIAVANSIVFLCATLKDRKLMSLRTWLYIQLIVLIPVVTTATDLLASDGRVSINPFEVYAGFI
jgi:hypothetical protein